MRRRAFFPAFLTATGQSISSSGAGKPAPVLFIEPGERQLRRSTLGEIPEGEWAVCPAETALALSERGRPRILYFDRYEYDAAMAGLNAGEREEAVRLRLRRWTPAAESYFVQRLFDIEAARWEGLAQTRDVQATLTRLQKLAGLDRYAMVSVDGMATAMLEGESRLIAELREAGELRQALDSRERWGAIALRTTRATGGVLPRTTLVRGVFVQGGVAAREARLKKDGVPFVRWRDGLVFSVGDRMPEDKAVRIYEDGAALEDVLEFSTQAQRERDFSARLARTAIRRRRDLRVHIDRLAMQQVLLKRELCGRMNCQANGVAGALGEEEDALARSASISRAFSAKLGWPEGPSAASLATEAKLFQSWAARHWPSLAPVLERVVE